MLYKKCFFYIHMATNVRMVLSPDFFKMQLINVSSKIITVVWIVNNPYIN